ncbi:MAG: hypothetical protein A2V90_04950 [Gammaproteobacteria bacterium RBG_16_57_12]|nr:MAG: hypothetical protein A2V90_04950 [Gammaproteobacteria bacterium RBG_16_57_12]
MLSEEVLEQLRECDDFPVPTSLMLRIIDLGRDPEASFDDVEDVIKTDPGMVARILQVANSPLYGVRQCDNLREALLLIGIDGSLALALAFCVQQMQKDMQRNLSDKVIDLDSYWRRSLLCALASRVIGRMLKRKDAEQLFLIGLMQDIGILALAQIRPQIYGSLPGDDAGNFHTRCCEAELAALGADHADVSAWLIEYWGLPQKFSVAAYCSHCITGTGLTQTQAEAFDLCVAFSGAIADMYLLSEFPASFRATAERMQALLGLNAAALADALSLVCAQVNQLEAIFAMPVLDEHLREQKLRQAQAALTMRML